MLKKIRNIASRILGAITGALTGIGAGFIPGYYACLPDPDKASSANEASIVLYLVSLPFCILWHMARGAFEGGTKGLMAGLSYPKTLNDEYRAFEINDQLNTKLQYCLNSSMRSPILTEYEELAFKSKLDESSKNEKYISKEEKALLSSRFQEYEKCMDKNKCAITGKALKDLQKPLVIHVNKNITLICEASALMERVQACWKKGIPTFITDLNNPKIKYFVHAENVSQLTIKSLDDRITNFIKRAKEILSPMWGIYQKFSPSICADIHVVNETKLDKQPSVVNVKNEVILTKPDSVEEPVNELHDFPMRRC